ncbi:LytR/AlgR family response regulator transcription factor [Undibacterium fentianense]|uniref:Response regulator transcription factor n=1 Tax=Undibacterium fentianense TaxID=2828728 RepID=A0A941E3U7_9BURK|nr:LytTR family DNA-binding domain-containing protein [Undibacterium fentianense]MBR7800607.1 response regulator transcription factor [Undibacterium fentianense]
MNKITAMLVDDEAPMRAHLRRQLQKIWPDLMIVSEAANSFIAFDEAQRYEPNIIFLDIRMPGKNGLEAAMQLAEKALIVFVTAYDEYAIQAFEQGALDYLLKPIDTDRLQKTCLRLQQRIQEKKYSIPSSSSPTHSNAASKISLPNQSEKNDLESEHIKQVLQHLIQHQTSRKDYLRWIQASVGNSLRMISTKEILYFKSDEKYTLVQTEHAEYLIRKTLKELEDELDPREFWRIHRSSLVRVSAIAEITRDIRGRHLLGLKNYSEKLEVSRNHTHLFQQM